MSQYNKELTEQARRPKNVTSEGEEEDGCEQSGHCLCELSSMTEHWT